MANEILPYEIWDNKRVKGMAKDWKNPLDLMKDTKAIERCRHWRLINSIYSLVEGFSILDVGCGMGHLYGLSRLDHDYIGLDSSEAMITKAKEFFPEVQDRFRVGSAYDLAVFHEADTVVASGLILHLPDPEPVLRQLWSKTVVSLVFSVWIYPTPAFRKTKQPHGQFIIQRSDTIENLHSILGSLHGIDTIAEFPFRNPYDGESNYLFKVRRNNG